MSKTQQDIRTGDFDSNKLLGSAINIWLDATEGWLSAVLVTASAPLPTVYLHVGKDTSTVCASVPVLVKAKLERTDLFQVGGEGRIDAAKLTVEQTTKGDGIVVRIPGWAEIESQIPPGLYQGIIYTGEKALANITLFYDENYKEANHLGRVVKKAKQ